MTLLEATAGQELARELDARRSELAGALTDLHYERRPALVERYGAIGRERCLQDAAYHLSYLAEALAAGAPDLFADYVAWAKVMLEGRGIPASDLLFNLETLRDVLRRELPAGQADLAAGYVDEGLARLPELPFEPPSVLPEEDDGPLGRLATDYLQALLRGERHVASRLVLEAVGMGVGVKDVYLHVFQRSQHEVGRLWQMNRLSVAQEHYCTAATQLIMSQLYPHIFSPRRNGRVLVAACVEGDLHEIGVRMISDFFAAEGWETFYLGANTPTASLVQILRDRRADVLAVSATMVFHLRAVSNLIAAVRASDVGERVRILVGGYPFNIVSDLWRLVGADAVARNAEESVAVAERLVREREMSLSALSQIGDEQPAAGFEDVALRLGDEEERDNRHYDELSRLNNDLATTQRELAKSNVELGVLNRQKNEFLGVASHDLRNPLEVILTYSQFLLDEAAESLRPEHLEFVRTIRSSSEFMLRLVEDLLDVTRIESGTLELDLAAVDLCEMVERNVALNRVLAAKKGTRIELRCDVPDMAPLVLDEAKIEQVLNNLIGNAVKYSPPGSTVEVRIEDGPEAAVISVRDQGEGLTPEEVAKLFRPFQRGRARSTAGEKSTGLGLAIVKRIVEGHRGEVRVESAEAAAGGGAIFSVFLPKAATPVLAEAGR